MQISWKWLNELVDLSSLKGPDELAEILTNRGIEVEEVRPLALGFEKVITVKILERNRHPDADRLSLCKVTTGTGEPLQIVCGAQNMKAGDIVALAQIGADLPNGLKITKSKIRGVESFGMLCSEEELKLKDKSEGILILPATTKPGQPVAEVLGLDDTVLTFKPTPNRGDCLSHLGIAREMSAALGKPVKLPKVSALPKGKSPIQIVLEAGDKTPQFYGCMIEGVKISPSPEWVVKRLGALGSRSINNVVDATNLLMFELGQPVHAYDADLIEGGKIGVRMAKAGERLPLLDGTEVKLLGSELVIFDGKRSVGLAGVMGGGNSEVSERTTRVFLECAEFNPVLVRKAAVAHARRTEAAQRFEKGIDPSGLEYAVSRLTQLVCELSGGRATASTKGIHSSRTKMIAHTIKLDPKFINGFLGTDFKTPEIKKSLESLGMKVKAAGSSWTVQTPSYRPDLTIAEDLAEEAARSLGFDKIPSTIPPLSGSPRLMHENKLQSEFELIHKAKSIMAEQGFCESLSYSFSSQAWLKELKMKGVVPLKNPMSEEQEVLVPSLLPGLLKALLNNAHHHFGSEPLTVRLFELRPTFALKGEGASAISNTETTVVERWKLSFLMSGPRTAGQMRQDQTDSDFYDVKAVFESLCEKLGVGGMRIESADVRSLANTHSSAQVFHPSQCARVAIGRHMAAGMIGLLHPEYARKWKLKHPVWIAEIDWAAVLETARSVSQMPRFQAWSEFPGIERDFALLVKDGVEAEKIIRVALKAGKPLAKTAKIFDTYKGSQVVEGMTSIAVRVIFSEKDRSLQESEADLASEQILKKWQEELGAVLRS